MNRIRLAACWLPVTACAAGCDDLSPLSYVAPLVDASVADAAVDGAAVSACRECLASTCAEPLATCNADPKCAILIECATVTDCFRQLNFGMLTVLPECATRCLERAGAAGVADPALLAAGGVFQCGISPEQCGPVCRE